MKCNPLLKNCEVVGGRWPYRDAPVWRWPCPQFQLKSDYEGAQAAFKSASPDKIYIDINAGLMSGKDISDLAKYAMLRLLS